MKSYKKSDFPVFCLVDFPPDFSTLCCHWFKRNNTCYLKVIIQARLIVEAIWLFNTYLIRAGDTGGLGGRGEGHATSLPTFLHSEKKKGKQREKRKTFKAETIKRLSPRSKCYCFSNFRASRIQKCFWSANHDGRQYLSVFHNPSTFKSISPALLM